MGHTTYTCAASHKVIAAGTTVYVGALVPTDEAAESIHPFEFAPTLGQMLNSGRVMLHEAIPQLNMEAGAVLDLSTMENLQIFDAAAFAELGNIHVDPTMPTQTLQTISRVVRRDIERAFAMEARQNNSLILRAEAAPWLKNAVSALRLAHLAQDKEAFNATIDRVMRCHTVKASQVLLGSGCSLPSMAVVTA